MLPKNETASARICDHGRVVGASLRRGHVQANATVVAALLRERTQTAIRGYTAGDDQAFDGARLTCSQALVDQYLDHDLLKRSA